MIPILAEKTDLKNHEKVLTKAYSRAHSFHEILGIKYQLAV